MAVQSWTKPQVQLLPLGPSWGLSTNLRELRGHNPCLITSLQGPTVDYAQNGFSYVISMRATKRLEHRIPGLHSSLTHHVTSGKSLLLLCASVTPSVLWG